MIADKDTNVVYLSRRLETDPRFPGVIGLIIAILEKYKINYHFLEGTKDIWARDYMPIQKGKNSFVQFRYEPSYLKDNPDIQSDPKEVCSKNNIKPTFSKINLDGGNVVKWSDKVLITDRIYSENPQYSKNKLISEIENLLETEVIIIPQLKSDFTGHADGLVKLIDSKTILGNDLDFEFQYWSKGMRKIISDKSFKYISMPFFEYKEKEFPNSAIGCYTNYLEIGSLIIFPIFDVTGNKDKEAVDLISENYPNKAIELININPVAREGGLMNCITWNIKS
jgi:agmatine deiminase